MKAWMSGNVAGTGTFRCTDCDYPVSLDAVDELPVCPNCGGTEFVRASLFTTAQTSVLEMSGDDDDQGWLEEMRDGLHEPGQYLAYRAEGETPRSRRRATRASQPLSAAVKPRATNSICVPLAARVSNRRSSSGQRLASARAMEAGQIDAVTRDARRTVRADNERIWGP